MKQISKQFSGKWLQSFIKKFQKHFHGWRSPVSKPSSGFIGILHLSLDALDHYLLIWDDRTSSQLIHLPCSINLRCFDCVQVNS
ncbi:hypothetical protein OIU74_005893 [Salix koriyanagi]|uniref:Uncharacterized protein n=1 Tax=Salix koriyanagi TaxID=2511006 RepID=A0A9Q0UD18_9ROSI|nr:hypothetical protein OIU74_005893 [Salix koriyanagi]